MLSVIHKLFEDQRAAESLRGWKWTGCPSSKRGREQDGSCLGWMEHSFLQQ